jgi:hypothetical protein
MFDKIYEYMSVQTSVLFRSSAHVVVLIRNSCELQTKRTIPPDNKYFVLFKIVDLCIFK